MPSLGEAISFMNLLERKKENKLQRQNYLATQELNRAKYVTNKLMELYKSAPTKAHKQTYQNLMKQTYHSYPPVVQQSLAPLLMMSPISPVEIKKMNFVESFGERPKLPAVYEDNKGAYINTLFAQSDYDNLYLDIMSEGKAKTEKKEMIPFDSDAGTMMAFREQNRVYALPIDYASLKPFADKANTTVYEVVRRGGRIPTNFAQSTFAGQVHVIGYGPNPITGKMFADKEALGVAPYADQAGKKGLEDPAILPKEYQEMIESLATYGFELDPDDEEVNPKLVALKTRANQMAEGGAKVEEINDFIIKDLERQLPGWDVRILGEAEIGKSWFPWRADNFAINREWGPKKKPFAIQIIRGEKEPMLTESGKGAWVWRDRFRTPNLFYDEHGRILGTEEVTRLKLELEELEQAQKAQQKTRPSKVKGKGGAKTAPVPGTEGRSPGTIVYRNVEFKKEFGDRLYVRPVGSAQWRVATADDIKLYLEAQRSKAPKQKRVTPLEWIKEKTQ